MLSQLLINGLIAGSIYALVAAGFSLIYSTSRIMHFAHGVSVTVGAYLTYLFYNILHVPFSMTVLLTVLLTGLFGLLVNFLVYEPLRKKEASNIIFLIASIGVLIFCENLLLLIFGSSVKSINLLKIEQGLHFFGFIITPLQIVIISVSLVILVLLYVFMYKSRFGRDMRAVADNRSLADIVGISYKKISYLSFFIGSALAGLAGLLIGLEQNISYTMGTQLIIKGFTGAVIGGITSVPASILGSYLVGVVENLGIWFLPSSYKDAIAFVLLIIFLLFRPTGLFGLDKGVRE